jgi:excisionase family DNA binding protein
MKHYAVNQVAEYFKVSKSTVQRWIRDGHLPNARKRGPARNSPYTVPESDVKSLEEQLRRPQEKARWDRPAGKQERSHLTVL